MHCVRWLLLCLVACMNPLYGEQAKETDPALFVVNKKVSLGTFIPKDLVSFEGHLVSQRIIKDLRRLLRDAKAAGLTLKVVSAYRSYDRQVTLFESWIQKELAKNRALTRSQAEELANTYSARPGHSEHQLGTTVDILSSENGYKFTQDKKYKFIGWLKKHAHTYNFKVSYPEGHPEYSYEPWHLRWYPASYLPTQNSLKT